MDRKWYIWFQTGLRNPAELPKVACVDNLITVQRVAFAHLENGSICGFILAFVEGESDVQTNHCFWRSFESSGEWCDHRRPSTAEVKADVLAFHQEQLAFEEYENRKSANAARLADGIV